MRQRKAPASGAPRPAAASAAQGGKRSSPALPVFTRLRILLLSLPLLLGWYIIFQRRSTARPLPTSFAICSHHSGPPQIHTMDASNSLASCVVVDHGKIKDVGSLEKVRKVWGDVDMRGSSSGIKIAYLKKGQMLTPGLIDSHAHILQYGESVTAVDLVGATSIPDVVKRIARWIAARPDVLEDRSKFILGLGWDQTKWPGAAFPTAQDLENDPRLAGRPIYLKRIDVHALWVSPTIVSRMGSLPETVPGGLIVRTPSDAPSGIFVDNAMSLVLAHIPAWTDEQRLLFLRTTARKMLDTGLTSVHDASLTREDIAFLTKLDKEGKLPIRIYGMVYCDPVNAWCGDEIERYDGDRFVLRAVKVFCDGALGSWGAAMHEPYSDNPTERGIMISEESAFAPLIKKWIDKGFQVNSHAIGDRANTILLDAYEQAMPATGGADLRLRIEHAQIMTIPDIERMGRMGVIASVQPTHATSDRSYAEARLGPERIKGAYAWASLIKNGSRIALGSDFPVESVDPMKGIYAAVYREGWYPNEALSMQQTLRGFTIDGAWASFQEDRVGSLEVGKEADFVVWDRDLTRIAMGEVPKTRLLATVVGGKLFSGRLL